MIRLGILGSTRGTHLLSLIEAIQKKELDASIEIVISNRAEALILERAKTNQLNTKFIDAKGLSREQYDDLISKTLKLFNVELVVLIGFMRILSSAFVKEWENKIINVHPSLLPNFAGKMDLDVHRAVLHARSKETGCTVHYVTEEVDGGAAIIQKRCEVKETDTIESLKTRVQALESMALVEAIQELI